MTKMYFVNPLSNLENSHSLPALRIFLSLCFLALGLSSAHAQRRMPDDSKGLIAHDPVMIKQDSVYYLFMTHGGIAKSTDLENWTRIQSAPRDLKWVTDDIVPGHRGGFWAPDIQYYDGLYYLYYSPSAFGKNTSAIGVMTNKTLHQDSPDYQWEDQGMIVQSIPGRDYWNAIDANVIFVEEEAGKTVGWLSFGSFWGGLKLVKLGPDMKSVAEPQEWYSIAQRENGTAIEAPFIYYRDGYYYQFASIDYCCRGLESTYKTIVGRSKDVRGPYLDKSETPMTKGGGELIVGETDQYVAVGHCSVYDFDGKTYFVAHGYDKEDDGKSKLVIKEIQWDAEGWPVLNF
ncbi:family 43 glycosylhydrolase [Algoriphagus halophytocola]|uniref:Family 43 glycosylhydrolase n=1 Tax=Algoriphagus halophytocola TaxID=2991499 RepID=A0ABY6MK22_9BACT|nr:MULTISPECIES: family 43 glycosylhydrolase [unclassified Algoriphagus]UZD23854.1 family 43 glycosylhydrolase [Algoriphagus sp. TR-M5]WBL41223.1 family 43 glycosylhydrolase [Algoriphagus sp. TR-M9]